MKLKYEHRRKARIIWQESISGGVSDFSIIRQKLDSLKKDNLRSREYILKALLERISLYLRENTLRIYSSEDTTEEQKKQILALVGDADKFLGGIEFEKDISLISGFKIVKGYNVEDFSISRQLEALKNTLMKN